MQGKGQPVRRTITLLDDTPISHSDNPLVMVGPPEIVGEHQEPFSPNLRFSSFVSLRTSASEHQPQNNGRALAVEVARSLVGHQNLRCWMRRQSPLFAAGIPRACGQQFPCPRHPQRHPDGNILRDADTVSCRQRGQQTELLQIGPTTTCKGPCSLSWPRPARSRPSAPKAPGVKLPGAEEASVFRN